jgi:hypothetical protein
MAAWPFATGNEPVTPEWEDDQTVLDGEQLYDLQRVYGGDVDFYDMTLEQAEEQVEKNIRQKKAQLKIVLAGTDEEI